MSGKLSDRQIKAFKSSGILNDGDGLLLVKKSDSSASWVLRVQKNKIRRDFGLGSYKNLSLSDARKKATYFRTIIESGKDPRIITKSSIIIPTFEEIARNKYELIKNGFKNEKHKNQWINTLRDYVFPQLKNLKVDVIEEEHIVKLLKPIWETKHETATRVLQRIGVVIEHAVIKKYRERKLDLDIIRRGLPSGRWKKVHHKSMPFSEVAAAYAFFKSKQSVSYYVMRATILSCLRATEAREAKWEEINLVDKIWKVPAIRMKGNTEHHVPLCQELVNIFKSIKSQCESKSGRSVLPNDYVFTGNKNGMPISEAAVSNVLKKNNYDYTVHGFRATFRTWLDEVTDFSGDVGELCLAHVISNKVEQAYRRSTKYEKRKIVMEKWADFCIGSA